MLTPQEVAQHAFAKASFGGYNMAMVDEFLDALTEDYTVLYKENQVLKGKMKILVDKVEEYRATDDSMRKAFLVAQKSAEDIVARAEAEREALVQRAEDEARAKIAGMRKEMEDEQHRLAAAQNATAIYIAKLQELCQHEQEYLASIPRMTTPAPTPVERAAHEIEASMQKVMAEETPRPEPTPEPEEVDEPTMDLDKELESLRFQSHASEDEEPEEESTKGDGGLYAELLELNIPRRSDRDGEHRPRRLATEEMGPEEAGEEEGVQDSSTRRFDNLQFGKDYEIR